MYEQTEKEPGVPGHKGLFDSPLIKINEESFTIAMSYQQPSVQH